MKRIEEKIELFAELFYSASAKMTIGQKRYAKKILEEILGHISGLEVENDLLRAKLSGENTIEAYKNSLEKCVSIIQCLDFLLEDVQQINKEETDFFLLHKDSIKSSGKITMSRFLNIIKLFRYFRQTHEREPFTLSELIDSYNEIKQLREQD